MSKVNLPLDFAWTNLLARRSSVQRSAEPLPATTKSRDNAAAKRSDLLLRGPERSLVSTSLRKVFTGADVTAAEGEQGMALLKKLAEQGLVSTALHSLTTDVATPHRERGVSQAVSLYDARGRVNLDLPDSMPTESDRALALLKKAGQ